MRIVEMVRNDIKNSSLLKTKFLIYAFNGRTKNIGPTVIAEVPGPLTLSITVSGVTS